jgi:cytochrome c peroxidase
VGVVKPYPTADTGRAAITGLGTDRFVFKVPSLRNVEKTGPYFHDGSVASLEEAIRLMGEYQLGRMLTDRQIADIRVFLGSLTGTIPAAYVAKPAMP